MIFSEQLLETDSIEFPEAVRWVADVPSDKWLVKQFGIWTTLSCGQLPKFGWKIHVSSTVLDAPAILALVSVIAFEANCAFKHLSGIDAFVSLHFKNASRLQSGKFIALYPTSEDLAAHLLERLYDSLYTYKGLDILTDRAYKDSTNVFYRWGAFEGTGRLDFAGNAEELVPNGLGQMIPDVRLPRFVLPEGIVDPFSGLSAPNNIYSPPTHVLLDRFIIDSVFSFSNAGGRYKGICHSSGAEVVIKEARPNTGFVGTDDAILRLRREAAYIEAISAKSIGLAPSVVKTFSVQDHEYIALEYLPGTRLSEWIATENPLYSCMYRSPGHVRRYLDRASCVLERISTDLATLHRLGIAFGDLSVGNLIVDENDTPRFIDFEACTAIDDVTLGLRTLDFCLLHHKCEIAAKERDTYAYHCIAIALVLRLTTLAELSDYVLQAVTKDLASACRDIPRWWSQACEYVATTSQQYSSHKTQGFIPPTLATFISRADIRNKVADAIVDCYEPDKEYLFPASAAAREGAYLSFGSGCGGLIHALRLNGTDIPEEVRIHFAKSVELAIEGSLLPTNYDVGLVGMIDPCLALGLNDLSARILELSRRSWSVMGNPSLGHGLAGISLTFHRHGYEALAEEVMERALQIAQSYEWEKNGLLCGRSGIIAGACKIDSLLKSSGDIRTIIAEMINREIGQTVRHPEGGAISLRGEVDGSRLLPYLSDGTAGLLLALTFAHRNEYIDYVLKTEELVSFADDLGTPFMLQGSLMNGAAGLAVVLEWCRSEFSDIAERIPDPGWDRIRKYLLPLKSGLGVLHSRSLKFDLSHSQGSAGILEALLWVDGMAELNLSGLYLSPRSVPTKDLR